MGPTLSLGVFLLPSPGARIVKPLIFLMSWKWSFLLSWCAELTGCGFLAVGAGRGRDRSLTTLENSAQRLRFAESTVLPQDISAALSFHQRTSTFKLLSMWVTLSHNEEDFCCLPCTSHHSREDLLMILWPCGQYERIMSHPQFFFHLTLRNQIKYRLMKLFKKTVYA